jgi:hypothetical protein
MSLAIRYAGCVLLGLTVELLTEGARPVYAALTLTLAVLMIVDSRRP